MKNVIYFCLLSKFILSCSVTQDFKFATVEEQTRYASVIFVGTVQHVSDPINVATVTFKNIDFYRGCLYQKSLKVKNFRGSSLCGPGIPRVGDRIIVYACENDNNSSQLSLNSFIAFTGWVRKTDQNLKIVKKITRNCHAKCKPNQNFRRCLNRETALKKKRCNYRHSRRKQIRYKLKKNKNKLRKSKNHYVKRRIKRRKHKKFNKIFRNSQRYKKKRNKKEIKLDTFNQFKFQDYKQSHIILYYSIDIFANQQKQIYYFFQQVQNILIIKQINLLCDNLS